MSAHASTRVRGAPLCAVSAPSMTSRPRSRSIRSACAAEVTGQSLMLSSSSPTRSERSASASSPSEGRHVPTRTSRGTPPRPLESCPLAPRRKPTRRGSNTLQHTSSTSTRRAPCPSPLGGAATSASGEGEAGCLPRAPPAPPPSPRRLMMRGSHHRGRRGGLWVAWGSGLRRHVCKAGPVRRMTCSVCWGLKGCTRTVRAVVAITSRAMDSAAMSSLARACGVLTSMVRPAVRATPLTARIVSPTRSPQSSASERGATAPTSTPPFGVPMHVRPSLPCRRSKWTWWLGHARSSVVTPPSPPSRASRTACALCTTSPLAHRMVSPQCKPAAAAAAPHRSRVTMMPPPAVAGAALSSMPLSAPRS